MVPTAATRPDTGTTPWPGTGQPEHPPGNRNPARPKAPVGGPNDRAALLGILFANGAVLAFTLMDGVIKDVAKTFPTGEIIFFRNLFAFIPLLIFAWTQPGGLPFRSRNPWGHVSRGIFGVTSMYFFFLSYLKLPLSEAIALGLSGPIFITVLSVPLLKEQVGWRRWSAVIVGFVGVIIMTRPDPAVFDVNALWPLLAAMFYALAMISIRRLGATEASTTIVFYFTAFATLASLLTIPLGWLDPAFAWRMPQRWDQFGKVVLIGLMGGCAQILLTNAYQRARASVVAPFDYAALVYGFLLGWIFFEEVPDRYLIVGGLVVVASGIYIIHRETTVARTRHAPPPIPQLPTNE